MDATFFHFMICNPIRQNEVWSFVANKSQQLCNPVSRRGCMEVKGGLSKVYTNSCAEIISQAGYVLI